MKRLLLSVGMLVILTACMSTSHVSYRLGIGLMEKQDQILQAVERVIQGRLGRQKVTPQNLTIAKDGNSAVLSFDIPSAEIAQALTEELSRPFTLSLMRPVNDGEEPDITLEQFGGFKRTSINENHVLWVEAGEDAVTKKGSVTLLFTPQGHLELGSVSLANTGKKMGLFVRDVLVSIFTIDQTFKKDITIDGIPSANLAKVFADDVNVGLHVTFTPLAENETASFLQSSTSSASSASSL